MNIFKTDREVVSEIFEKESAFVAELKELSLFLSDYTIRDYLGALKDCKEDFLLPLKEAIQEN